jgi:hypothetical protein
MKLAGILLVSGQLAGLAFLVLGEVVFDHTGDGWDVFVASALAAYLIACGAGIVFVALVVLGFIRRLPEATAGFLEEIDTAEPEAATWTAVGVDVVGGLGLFLVGYVGVLLAGSTQFNALLLGALLGAGFVRLHRFVRRRLR